MNTGSFKTFVVFVLATVFLNGCMDGGECAAVRDQLTGKDKVIELENWVDVVGQGISDKKWHLISGSPSIIGDYAISVPTQELPIRFERNPEIRVVLDELKQPAAIYFQIERMVGLLVSLSPEGKLGATSPPKKNLERISDRVFLVCIQRD